MPGLYGDFKLNDLIRAAHPGGSKVLLNIKSPSGGDAMIEDIVESQLHKIELIYKYRTASVLADLSQTIKTAGDYHVGLEVDQLVRTLIKSAAISEASIKELRSKVRKGISKLTVLIDTALSNKESVLESIGYKRFKQNLRKLETAVHKDPPDLAEAGKIAQYLMASNTLNGNSFNTGDESEATGTFFSTGEEDVRDWFDQHPGGPLEADKSFDNYKSVANELRNIIGAAQEAELEGSEPSTDTAQPALESNPVGTAPPDRVREPTQNQGPAPAENEGDPSVDIADEDSKDSKYYTVSFTSPITGANIQNWDMLGVLGQVQESNNPFYLLRHLQSKGALPREWADKDVAKSGAEGDLDELFAAIATGAKEAGASETVSTGLPGLFSHYFREMNKIVNKDSSQDSNKGPANQTVMEYLMYTIPGMARDIHRSQEAMNFIIGAFDREGYSYKGFVDPFKIKALSNDRLRALLASAIDFGRSTMTREMQPDPSRPSQQDAGAAYQSRDTGNKEEANFGTSVWQHLFKTKQKDPAGAVAFEHRLMPGSARWDKMVQDGYWGHFVGNGFVLDMPGNYTAPPPTLDRGTVYATFLKNLKDAREVWANPNALKLWRASDAYRNASHDIYTWWLANKAAILSGAAKPAPETKTPASQQSVTPPAGTVSGTPAPQAKNQTGEDPFPLTHQSPK
jgi:hypothetical protein